MKKNNTIIKNMESQIKSQKIAMAVIGFLISSMLSLNLGQAVFAAVAPASVVIDTINGDSLPVPCVAGPISITGHGTTGGSGGPYQLDIGWGDGSATTTITAAPGLTSGSLNGAHKDFTFSASHTPIAASVGLTVFLHHSQASGQDSNMIIVSQCIAPPTTAVLTVKKHAINDGLGAAVASNFTVHVKDFANNDVPNGGNGVSSPTSGSETGKDFIVTPPASGVYTVSEDAFPGYTQTGIVCENTTDNLPLVGSSIVLAAGKNYACTITNNDNNNTAPVLSGVPSSVTIPEMALYTFTATASDSDVPAQTLTFSLVGAPAGATIAASTGVFSWTPSEAQGPNSYPFVVRVSDGVTNTDVNITINVTEVNATPVALDASVATPMNTSKIITLGATDSDFPVNTLVYSIVVGPSNGTLGSISGNQITYTPNTSFVGPDSFTFKVNDGTIDSNTATISITVSNDAPSLASIEDKSVNELATLAFTAVGTDPNSDTLTYSLDSNSLSLGMTINTTTGEFSWTPTEAQGPGDYVVTISVTDGASTDSQTFTITVNEVNVAPTADAKSLTLDEDTSGTVTLTGSDADIPVQSLTFATTTNPLHGTVTLSGDVATYVPDANYNGSDSFTYSTNDGATNSAPATVTITVTPVNDAPTITLLGDNPLSLVAGDTFTDPGATSTDVEDGSLPVTTTGTVDANTPGTYTLTYTATDSDDATVSVTRTVIVTAVPVENTAPLCSDGVDNDNDGLIDLADPDCAAFVPPPSPPPSGGGGGSSSGGGLVGQGFGGGGIIVPTSGSAPAPQGEVLGATTSCGLSLNSYIKYGTNNDSGEVMKLQSILNDIMGSTLPITGFYGSKTRDVVNQFQVKYAAEVLRPWVAYGLPNETTPTGYVYKTTKRWINMLKCPELALPIPQLP